VFEESGDVIAEFMRINAPHVTMLERGSELIDGVAFLGTTLWTPAGTDSKESGNQIFKLRVGMNDFNIVYTRNPTPGGYLRRFHPLDAANEHELSVKWLTEELKKTKKSKTPTVVITHHAPSYLSKAGNKRYTDDPGLDAGYYSSQDALIKKNPQIAYWIHGHTHHNVRYQIGKTTVLTNQRGYVGHDPEAAHFDPAAADFELEEIFRRAKEAA
jgi:hypothetical protein